MNHVPTVGRKFSSSRTWPVNIHSGMTSPKTHPTATPLSWPIASSAGARSNKIRKERSVLPAPVTTSTKIVWYFHKDFGVVTTVTIILTVKEEKFIRSFLTTRFYITLPKRSMEVWKIDRMSLKYDICINYDVINNHKKYPVKVIPIAIYMITSFVLLFPLP